LIFLVVMPIEVLMPSLSPTMTEGNVARWLKKEGDKISMGDIIAEVETDKATMEVEATDEGILGKIIAPDGAQAVQVNSVIALLLKKGEDKSVLNGYSGGQPTNVSAAAAPAVQSSSQQDLQKPIALNVITEGGRTIASPLAKRIAENDGIDLAGVSGTGPHGRIVKQDVLDASKNLTKKTSQPQIASCTFGRRDDETTSVPHTNIRKVIAKRLLESKQTVPHFYLSADCVIDDLLNYREGINELAAKDESGKAIYKISVNDMVIKACAMALKKVPQANASWTETASLYYNNIDISVAVSTDGGLITPIVKNADMKSLSEISAEMKLLAKKARENKLQPHEFQGGSFSISNLGMYGVKEFKAIINPPQAVILAVGASELKPVIAKDGSVKAANVLSISISCDHRIVDGALAAVLLGEIKNNLQKPYLMLV
jgi:pyruvate dehydrogenase E2 component (dihydrolipoamide acetyltransferase)